MKSLHSKLSGIAPFIFFPLLIIFRKGKYTLYGCIFLVLLSLSSCYLNYYTTNTRSSVDANTMTRLKSENKYFIIHFFNSTYGLENMYMEGDTLHGKLVGLTNEHLKYLHPATVEKNRYKRADEAQALMEVHMYTNANNKPGDSIFAASLSSFNRSDIYEFNGAATRKNHILSTVGIVATVVGIASFITFAIAIASLGSGCNCPQVYLDNAGTYSFKGGLYSGAVYSTLERIDYLPLKEIPADAKSISFKISNAKNEEQFINNVHLIQVNHVPDVTILPDRHGNFFSYSSIASPLSVSTDGKNNLKNVLVKTDQVYYSFDNRANENGLSDLILTFNKPHNTDKAKLIIHGRNTYWGGLLHKEFISYFGDGFEKWREKQEKADPKELEKWQTDQALPLMVYIKTSTGWKFVDYYPLIGNTATRDMIMEINTEKIEEETIKLKIETAYRFWDLDFAGIDYSTNDNIINTIIEPDKAVASDSTDERTILRSSDHQYAHLTGDESIYFKYTVPVSPKNNLSSYFLVSSGYYHNLEQITGKTNFMELYKFQKKGAFDKFSREKYQQTLEVASMLNGTKKK
jgi:hypothetical protein